MIGEHETVEPSLERSPYLLFFMRDGAGRALAGMNVKVQFHKGNKPKGFKTEYNPLELYRQFSLFLPTCGKIGSYLGNPLRSVND